MKTKILLLLCLFTVQFASANIIPVPAAYTHIQGAINAAVDGDTIAVSPGVYYENINFHGKRILVTSLYYLTEDTSYVSATVINGSMPASPDSGSCVIFNSGEDAQSILQGFKITGGTGTLWTDIHGAGVFREGGGILIDQSSPVIRHNHITGNTATDMTGAVSAGGGGIRAGDGNPKIVHNLITYNQGRYGAGIVLDYSGGVIRNNVIAHNTGGQDYHGGSGIWIYENLPSIPKIIENNTLVANEALAPNGSGGILVQSAADVEARNNIVYSNIPSLQVKTISSAPQFTYCNVESGFPGTGNMSIDPEFLPNSYQLSPASPCVDAGDDDAAYADLEDQQNPGFALYPSLGQLRNDMGAFGGPGADILFTPLSNPVGFDDALTQNPIQVFPNPFEDQASWTVKNVMRAGVFELFDSKGNRVIHQEALAGDRFTIARGNLAPGIYVGVLSEAGFVLGRQQVVIQ